MGKLFLNVTGWLIRKFGLLLLLIAALLLAPSVLKVWKVVREFDPATVAHTIKMQVQELAPRENAPKEEIERQLKILRDELERKLVKQGELSNISCILPTCYVVKSADLYRIDMEIALLQQALIYVEAVSNGTNACDARSRISKRLQEARVNEAELENGRPVWAPRTQEHLDLRARIESDARIQVEKERICQRFLRLSKQFEANQTVVQEKMGHTYATFLAKLEELKQAQFTLLKSAMVVFPVAFWTLLGIIFVPIGVKMFSYYGVATWASRRFGVRLLPETSGELTVVSPSRDLQRIELERGWELLLDPTLLRSSPDSADKDTKYLLDWSMPLSSFASGQYMLTRIQGGGTFTISDDKNSVSKITVLELPENSALVLQPRCLVGIVQRVDRPIRITRHWRLGVGSWLTLQLRYVVFHGPAKLIVRGNHGVEADAAQEGSSINQAATLGFSANLGYGVTRCETFYAYLSGKKELFNDCFSSGPGYYVHEVRPEPAKKTMLPGRGIEGILNSLLQVFGL